MDKEENINIIKEVLESQGRSQSWLARQLGLTFTSVNAWCNNRSQPDLKKLVKVARLLEVAPADLIYQGRKKEKAPKNEAFAA